MSDTSTLVAGDTIIGYLSWEPGRDYPDVICKDCIPAHARLNPTSTVAAIKALEAAQGKLRSHGFRCIRCGVEVPHPVLRPEIGMGATEHLWSDRHAYTITEVSPSFKSITIQADRSRRVDQNGMSECQHYEFTPNPEGPTRVARLCTDGHFHIGGKHGNLISIGYRDAYYDFTL